MAGARWPRARCRDSRFARSATTRRGRARSTLWSPLRTTSSRPTERERYSPASPYNVVRLIAAGLARATRPALRRLAAATACSSRRSSPARLVAAAGLRRPRRRCAGRARARRARSRSSRTRGRRPAARAHVLRAEAGAARACCAPSRANLSPIFLLHDEAPRRSALAEGEPDARGRSTAFGASPLADHGPRGVRGRARSASRPARDRRRPPPLRDGTRFHEEDGVEASGLHDGRARQHATARG